MLYIKQERILTLLELATVFTADKTDCRIYLHDVICNQTDNNAEILAANGHMCVKINIKNNDIDGEPIVTPSRLLVRSIKDANKVKNISLLQDNAVTKDMKYPDINRLIPDKFVMGSDIVGINANYLAVTMTALSKTAKKLSGDKFFAVKLVQTSKDAGNIFTCNIGEDIDILIMIMPTRL